MALLLFGVTRAIQQVWLSDDYFITLRHSDNVIAGHGPVYNPGERTEGYTHFLWFVLLTAGRALRIDPIVLGSSLGFPAYVASLLLLVHISGRLFPGRGGLWGIPAAALGWALHEDAQLFASGGLETALFILLLLSGFAFLCTSTHPRRMQLAAWAYALSTLVRPEGILFSAIALLCIGWHGRDGRPNGGWKKVRHFALVWIALVAPLFLFRLAYYGYPFPNPYYAKSGNLAYWSQGWWYLSLYFGTYFVLMASVFAAWPVVRAWRSPVAAPVVPPRVADPLLLALISAGASVLYVTRVGGDYMFARLFLPATPFLLLLCESLVHLPRREAWRRAAAAALCVGVVAGAVLKHRRLSADRPFHGITDESKLHSFARLERIRTMGSGLSACLDGTRVKILAQGGQASLAYFARFPIAIESYGLTDARVARQAIQVRGRPGHEKFVDARYVHDNGIALRFSFRPMRSVPQFARIGIPTRGGTVEGEILTYQREIMEQLKRCPNIRFLDFPIWLQHVYIPANVPQEPPERLIREFNYFKRFYFDHNPDPEGLLESLRAALAVRGIHNIPVIEIPEHEDTGQADWSPSVGLGR